MKFRAFFALLLTVTLAACSSGGGSGGGGGGSAPSGAVSIPTNTLSFFANVSNGETPVQILTGTINNPDSDVFLFVDLGYSNIFQSWNYTTSGSQANLLLTPTSPQQIGAGVHTGQIEVRVCRDANCTSQYSGSPKTVNVTYTVTGTDFSLSANEINLKYVFGSALPDVQEIVATAAGPWVYYGWSDPNFPRSSDWINLDFNQPDFGNPVIFQFGLRNPLPAGEYLTTFGLYFDGPAVAKPVAVKVTVLEPPFLIDANTVDFSYRSSDADLSALQKTITVSEGTYGPRTWNVSTDAEWLDISHDSGNTTDNNSFVVSVNAGVEDLQTGQYQTWVNLSDADGNYDDIRIRVQLAKDAPTQVVPETGCLEEAGVIFIDCESNEWNGFTAWEQRADGGMPSYMQPMPGFHLIDWSIVDAGDHGNVVDVRYDPFVDARAMLRVYSLGSTRDLSHYAGGTVEFDVRVLDWGSAVNGLEFKLECIWPCESGSFPLNIPNLNQWYHFSFYVDQLQATGFDLRKADMGFQIFPAWEGGSMNGLHFQLDNIRWNR
jgi:hypothetical protein